MTVDGVLLTSLYAVTFDAALRRVPLFSPPLVAVWSADVAMQLVVAELVVTAPGLPPDVAVALRSVLVGNVHKVVISAAVWLPYLVLSKRVNLTYRLRSPAG